jgi:hypothetical protein
LCALFSNKAKGCIEQKANAAGRTYPNDPVVSPLTRQIGGPVADSISKISDGYSWIEIKKW